LQWLVLQTDFSPVLKQLACTKIDPEGSKSGNIRGHQGVRHEITQLTESLSPKLVM